jgi:uncharacterized protein involved in outer membrane biogenesis
MSEQNSPPSKTRKRNRIILLCTLFVAFYAVMGFLVIPKIIHPIAEEQLSKHLNREVAIERIRLNPFTLSGTLENFLIMDHDEAPLFSLKKSYANFQIVSIFTQNWTFKKVSVDEPYGRIVMNKDRTLNVTDLLEKLTGEVPDENAIEEKDEEADKVNVAVGHLVISSGVFEYTDHSLPLPFETVAKPINIDLRDFGTSSDTEAPYAFSATTESGESFSWEGDVLLNPIRSSGEISVSNISLPKYKPFHYGLINLHVAEGKLSFTSHYQYDLINDVRLSNASITFADLLMQTIGSDIDVLKLESVQVEGAAINLKEQTAEIDSVVIESGHIQIERMVGGALDVEGIVPPSEEQLVDAAVEESTSEETEPVGTDISEWAVLLKSFEIKGSSLALIDNSLQNPATLAFDDIQLKIENISNEADQTASLSLTTHSRHGGEIRTNGTFSLLPVSANLNIALDAFTLDAFNNHVNERADVEIKGGNFNLAGNVALSLLEESNEPNLHFTGGLNINDLQTVDGKVAGDLVAWTDLAITDINYTHLPASLEIGKIAVTDPRANVFVDEKGVLNVSTIFPNYEAPVESSAEEGGTVEEDAEASDQGIEEEESEEGETEEELLVDAETEATSPLPFPVKIAEILIQNGSVIFLDESLEPSVSFLMDDFKGTIIGLESDETSRADIDLSGRLNNSSLLTISGQANPLAAARYVDVQVDLNNFELPPLGSYFGKFVGYGLEKGQFSAGMTYKLSGNELSGENLVKVDQLTLGEKTDSPDAPNLPIPLAISLLQNRDGLIELNVPVSGNVDDPSFSYGSVISNAIINVITKIVTSPFSVLGSIFGGGSGGDGEEFKYVSFDPGASDVSTAGSEKLDTLAEVLYQRPNLRLEIISGVDGEVDKLALQQQKFDALLQNPKGLETVAAEEITGTSEGSPESNAFKRGFARVKSWVGSPKKEEEVTSEADPSLDQGEVEDAVLGPEDMEVTSGELHELAFARANSVKAHLLATEKVEADRLFFTVSATEEETIGSGKVQVDFLLK